MDPKTTAVVLIEYQNDFTSEGGSLHDAVKGVMEQEHMLPNSVETVEKARELGARSRGITTIALGGFLTNCCVESTMRTGYEKGFEVITLKDCTATLSEEEQRLAVEKNYPMFSRPMDHNEFIAKLSGIEAAETTGRGYSG